MTNGFLGTVLSKDFLPHGYCFMWQPELVWMHVLSDLVIMLSYFSIPLIIGVILLKERQKLPYHWVFLMFAMFIFFCGLTHLFELIGIWTPYYYLEGIIKVITAAISLATAILMLPLAPVVLRRLHELKLGDAENGRRKEDRYT